MYDDLAPSSWQGGNRQRYEMVEVKSHKLQTSILPRPRCQLLIPPRCGSLGQKWSESPRQTSQDPSSYSKTDLLSHFHVHEKMSLILHLHLHLPHWYHGGTAKDSGCRRGWRWPPVCSTSPQAHKPTKSLILGASFQMRTFAAHSNGACSTLAIGGSGGLVLRRSFCPRTLTTGDGDPCCI